MEKTTIYVASLPIRLGQLLKYASLVSEGIEAKILIQNGHVKVNGCIERRRGKKIQHSDTIQIDEGLIYTVTG